MPDPEVVTAARGFRAGLLAREHDLMVTMAGRWADVQSALDASLYALAADMADQREQGLAITPETVWQSERARRLRAQVIDEFTKYADYADPAIAGYQREVGGQGLQNSVYLTQQVAGVGVRFDRLPVEAVENMVGIARDGGPLGDLLHRRLVRDEAGTELPGVWDELVKALVRGTALGRNPRDVARDVAGQLAGGLNKALVIARTEGLRPYREMSRAQYVKSGVVEAQKRLCAHDARVCAACIADDGQRYPLMAVIPDHVQGRCTSVPVVIGMPETTWLAGEDWLREQDPATQLDILGPGRLQLWQDGRISFADLVQRTQHDIWGDGIRPRTIADLLAGGRDQWPPITLPSGPTGDRPVSGQESELQAEIDEIQQMVDEMIAGGDPAGGGMLGYLDSLQQGLADEQQINAALWDQFGIEPGQASNDQWLDVADTLQRQGYDLYQKYTKEGIEQLVAERRNAQASGYMQVGGKTVAVRRGAFSVRDAQRMRGELWREGKGELRQAAGELLQRAGYSAADIEHASYEQRQRLLAELGNKRVTITGSGRTSKIDRVPEQARAQATERIDYDLAATCGTSAVDPLALPTLDAYRSMQLADEIRATRIEQAQSGGQPAGFNW